MDPIKCLIDNVWKYNLDKQSVLAFVETGSEETNRTFSFILQSQIRQAGFPATILNGPKYDPEAPAEMILNTLNSLIKGAAHSETPTIIIMSGFLEPLFQRGWFDTIIQIIINFIEQADPYVISTAFIKRACMGVSADNIAKFCEIKEEFVKTAQERGLYVDTASFPSELISSAKSFMQYIYVLADKFSRRLHPHPTKEQALNLAKWYSVRYEGTVH